MSTVSGAISKIIRQDIQPGVDSALTEIAPLFAEIQNSSMSVVRDHIGQDWKVIKTLLTSLAGTFKASGDVGGDGVVSTTTPYTVHSAPSTFQGVSGFVSPGYVQKTFTLQEYMGNMFIPQEFLRADRLTASLGSAVSAVIQQTARQIALVKANMFFTPSDTTKQLAQGDGATAVTNAAGNAIANGHTSCLLTLSSVSRVRNIQPGMSVDLWDGADLKNSTGGTAATRFDLIVYSVDPITNQVRLDVADGSSTFVTAHLPAVSDIITLKESKGNGAAGLEDWIKASGTLYTNLDLAIYPQFKSIVKAVGGSLTDDILRKYLYGFIQGHGAGMAPDTLLTTEGVLNEYVSQVDADRRWVAQGQAQSVKGGYQDGVSFELNGRVFNFKVGEMVPGGYLYALKLRDKNLKRYMPPKLPGSDSRTEFDNIEFVASLGGSKDIWKHAHYNSNTTKYVEAPFVCIEEIVPDVIPALKLTGLTENIATA